VINMFLLRVLNLLFYIVLQSYHWIFNHSLSMGNWVFLLNPLHVMVNLTLNWSGEDISRNWSARVHRPVYYSFS